MTTTAGPGQDLEHLVYMATCAPSVHNTQPWRFIETATGLDLVRDETRRLDVIDPWGRELLMSCGAALDHLAVAARAIGMSSAITVGVDGQHVAHVELSPGPAAIADEIDLAVAILNRHTHRGRFTGLPVSPAELALLTRWTWDGGTGSGVLKVVIADSVPAEHERGQRTMTLGPARPRTHREGLPSVEGPLGAAISSCGSRLGQAVRASCRVRCRSGEAGR